MSRDAEDIRKRLALIFEKKEREEIATERRRRRWENGHQLPNFFTLERIAQETDLEVVIGLREPEATADEFVALAVLEDEGRMTEVRMLHDFRSGTAPVPPAAWREKIGYEVTGFSDLIR